MEWLKRQRCQVGEQAQENGQFRTKAGREVVTCSSCRSYKNRHRSQAIKRQNLTQAIQICLECSLPECVYIDTALKHADCPLKKSKESNGHRRGQTAEMTRNDDARLLQFAYILVTRINDDLASGYRHYRNRAGVLLTTLDEVVRAILEKNLQ